jgi:oligopeptide transport system substrate-binding protein
VRALSLEVLPALAVLLAACTSNNGGYYGSVERSSKDVNTFYVNNSAEPEYIDPGLVSESTGGMLVRDLFDGLAQLHPETLEPIQAVASHYDKSEDNRFFRFYLREDAHWSNGKPVVAEDFVYSWRRVLTPSTGARMVSMLYPIKNAKAFHQGKLKDVSKVGVRARGEHVLEVTLEQPTPHFLELVAFQTYFPVPRDVVEQYGDRWTRPQHMVTNGPYTIVEHQFRYEYVFERNPHYTWHDDLKLHRIRFFEVQDYYATLALYKTGELDWIGSNSALPSTQLETLKKFKDFRHSPWLATFWYEFNTSKKPVDDVRVRRALNLGVDKQLIVDKITRGGQTVATHVVPDFCGSGYADAAAAEPNAFVGKGYDFDPALARELLRDAGYPVAKRGEAWFAEGFPGVEILYNSGEAQKKIAVAIQSMWKDHLGITVQIRNEEWKVMIKSLRDGHYQVARLGWYADYNHPLTFLETYVSTSANNWTRFADPKLDALLEKAGATADPVESISLYRQAEQLAHDGMARLPLYFYTRTTMIKPHVKGYFPNSRNKHGIRWMWIDPNWGSDAVNRPAYEPQAFPAPKIVAVP